MKHILIALLLSLSLAKTINAQQMRVFEQFQELEPLLQTQSDTTYVVNFWATWCKPCVLELPYFQQLSDTYASRPVKVWLVSLDLKTATAENYLARKGYTLQSVHLDDADSNSWINKVCTHWSGAIPATLIFDKDKRSFFEQEFSYERLQAELEKFLKLQTQTGH